MKLRTPIGWRLVVALVVITVTAAGAAVATSTPAYAAVRYRAESGHDANSPKSAIAECPPGTVLIGTGGRIKDGNGGVRLDAIVPTGNSVEVRGEALSGYAGRWSVVAVAFCVPDYVMSPTVEVSPAGSPTATCPRDAVVSGSGFDLPDGVPLTGLVTDAAGRGVTVRTAFTLIGGVRTAYAVCAPARWDTGDPRYFVHFDATSPVDTSARKVVTVRSGSPHPPFSGAGARVTVVGDPSNPIPIVPASVFIDALLPSPDGTEVTVEAVRTWRGADLEPVPLSGRIAGSSAGAAVDSAAGDEADPWSVTGYGYGVDHDTYWVS